MAETTPGAASTAASSSQRATPWLAPGRPSYSYDPRGPSEACDQRQSKPAHHATLAQSQPEASPSDRHMAGVKHPRIVLGRVHWLIHRATPRCGVLPGFLVRGIHASWSTAYCLHLDAGRCPQPGGPLHMLYIGSAVQSHAYLHHQPAVPEQPRGLKAARQSRHRRLQVSPAQHAALQRRLAARRAHVGDQVHAARAHEDLRQGEGAAGSTLVRRAEAICARSRCVFSRVCRWRFAGSPIYGDCHAYSMTYGVIATRM